MFKSEEVTAIIEPRRLPSPDRNPERNLAVTPLDLRQAKFSTTLRGFDRTEVTSLLQEAAEGYDQAVRENERLRQEIARLDGSLDQYRKLEDSLKTTLVSAQKLADDTRENATKEAAQIVRDAEGRGEAIIQKAQARFDDMLREIDALKLKRREAETNIEATIFALRGTLDFVREQDPRGERTLPAPAAEKVVPHRPRVEVSHVPTVTPAPASSAQGSAPIVTVVEPRAAQSA